MSNAGSNEPEVGKDMISLHAEKLKKTNSVQVRGRESAKTTYGTECRYGEYVVQEIAPLLLTDIFNTGNFHKDEKSQVCADSKTEEANTPPVKLLPATMSI